jgi:Rod binding domain-containing protein
MENANMGTSRPLCLSLAGSLSPQGMGQAPSFGATGIRDLREATGEFESLYIAQIMQAMRATVPESGLMGSGSGQRVFQEMMDQELSRQVAHSGGLGIGEILYRQLTAGHTSPTDGAQEGSDDENR